MSTDTRAGSSAALYVDGLSSEAGSVAQMKHVLGQTVRGEHVLINDESEPYFVTGETVHIKAALGYILQRDGEQFALAAIAGVPRLVSFTRSDMDQEKVAAEATYEAVNWLGVLEPAAVGGDSPSTA